MQLLSIRTRVLTPPKDNLFDAIEESAISLQEGDIVLVTSKVVSIHEGRCIRIGDEEKEELICKEAELSYKTQSKKYPITVVHHALISSSGIDESNGSGYYTLLPKNPFASARTLHTYFRETFDLKDIGVIITDSHSSPFRYGAMSIGIGCWGSAPIESHIGKRDLFGREIEYAKTNIVDALSASATLVGGECAEATPLVIARDIPSIVFTDENPRPHLFVPYEEDLFRGLFEQFKKNEPSNDQA